MALKLVPAGYRLIYDLRALSRGSYGESVAAIRQAIDSGLMSPAEGREALEMPPAEGPDAPALEQFVISKNYTQQSSSTASDVGMGATSAAASEG